MNSSNYRFTLDMHKAQSQTSIPAVLGDTGRVLHISFTDGGNPYTIETGCLAMLTIKRPTGTMIEEFCEIKNNTTVVYPFSQNENTCAVEGINECDVTLFGTDGRKITSPRFSLIVSNSVAHSDDIVITDETLSVIDSILTAEALRQDAESKRVEAELKRVEADSRREEAVRRLNEMLDGPRMKPIHTTITLLASDWVGEEDPYSQIVSIEGVTEHSKVDLQPSVEQLAIFHDKDLAFVTENEDGVVTVYAIGDRPSRDYTMQATITEVDV